MSQKHTHVHKVDEFTRIRAAKRPNTFFEGEDDIDDTSLSGVDRKSEKDHMFPYPLRSKWVLGDVKSGVRNYGEHPKDLIALGATVLAVFLAPKAIEAVKSTSSISRPAAVTQEYKTLRVKPGEGISDVVHRAYPDRDQDWIDGETNEIVAERHGNTTLHAGEKIKVDPDD